MIWLLFIQFNYFIDSSIMYNLWKNYISENKTQNTRNRSINAMRKWIPRQREPVTKSLESKLTQRKLIYRQDDRKEPEYNRWIPMNIGKRSETRFYVAPIQLEVHKCFSLGSFHGFQWGNKGSHGHNELRRQGEWWKVVNLGRVPARLRDVTVFHVDRCVLFLTLHVFSS